MLLHARSRGTRIRPFAAVGPALQAVRASEPLESSRGIYRFAFKQAGIIAGAWNFRSTPPLEGGGIFQVGLQYGGGVSLYLTEHLILRADFRETLSQQPDVWTDSHDTIRNSEIQGGRVEPARLETHGPMRLQSFTLGLGIGF